MRGRICIRNFRVEKSIVGLRGLIFFAVTVKIMQRRVKVSLHFLSGK